MAEVSDFGRYVPCHADCCAMAFCELLVISEFTQLVLCYVRFSILLAADIGDGAACLPALGADSSNVLERNGNRIDRGHSWSAHGHRLEPLDAFGAAVNIAKRCHFERSKNVR